MNKFLTIFASSAVFVLSACGEEPFKVKTMKRGDKDLGCSDILLEVNEAEFHKKQADEKKSLGVKSIVMPLGYIDTYMSADEAISAAESRIAYLNRIYEIKNCDFQSNSNPQFLGAKSQYGAAAASAQVSGVNSQPMQQYQPPVQVNVPSNNGGSGYYR